MAEEKKKPHSPWVSFNSRDQCRAENKRTKDTEVHNNTMQYHKLQQCNVIETWTFVLEEFFIMVFCWWSKHSRGSAWKQSGYYMCNPSDRSKNTLQQIKRNIHTNLQLKELWLSGFLIIIPLTFWENWTVSLLPVVALSCYWFIFQGSLIWHVNLLRACLCFAEHFLLWVWGRLHWNLLRGVWRLSPPTLSQQRHLHRCQTGGRRTQLHMQLPCRCLCTSYHFTWPLDVFILGLCEKIQFHMCGDVRNETLPLLFREHVNKNKRAGSS